MARELQVLALTRYGRLGPSSRLRTYQFLPALQCHGIRVSTHPLLDDASLAGRYDSGRYRLIRMASAYSGRLIQLLGTHRYDVLWIEKEIYPWLPNIFERIPRLLHVPQLADYDDATFHPYDQHSSRRVRWLLARKIAAVMRTASVVTVGNDYLRDAARARVHRTSSSFQRWST